MSEQEEKDLTAAMQETPANDAPLAPEAEAGIDAQADAAPEAEESVADEILKSLQAMQEAKAPADDDVDEEEPQVPEYEEPVVEEEAVAEAPAPEEAVAQRSYEGLSEAEILASIRELADKTMESQLDAAYEEMKRAREAMNALYEGQKAAAKAQFVEAGGEEEGFKFEGSSEQQQFRGLFDLLQKRRSEYHAQMTHRREASLKIKQEILSELRKLTELPDLSKVTSRSNTERVKDLEKRWKEAGPVPKNDAEELYKSYRALLDRFYEDKRKAFEMQRLDRQRNLELKTAICERAEALLQEENINEAARQLNQLHDEYKSLGPVPRDQQEALWQRFKASSDTIYDKKREYADTYKKQLQENMELKQALCLRAESYAVFESESIKGWNQSTKELLAIQEEWEKVGALPREVAKDINRQFWANFKQFFANKNKFFEALDAERADNLKRKEALCEQAEALAASDDWEATTEKLKELQQEWRGIGPVPEKQKDSIYARFKAACDSFFDRKRNRRSSEDQAQVANLKEKEDICAQIEAMAKAGNPDLEALKKLKVAFMEVGFVPRKAMNDIADRFSEAVEAFFAATSLDEQEREKQVVAMLVDVAKESGGSGDRGVAKKRQTMRNKINQLEDEIALLENNLTFFGKSKNAQKLVEDFSKKIALAQEKLERMRKQYRMFNTLD
jgi:hypothetical protein